MWLLQIIEKIKKELPARVVQKTFAALMQIEIVSQTFRSVAEKGVPQVDQERGEREAWLGVAVCGRR